jgi:hypothetical protein
MKALDYRFPWEDQTQVSTYPAIEFQSVFVDEYAHEFANQFTTLETDFMELNYLLKDRDFVQALSFARNTTAKVTFSVMLNTMGELNFRHIMLAYFRREHDDGSTEEKDCFGLCTNHAVKLKHK